MNVLIFEYITGGGMMGKALPAALIREGELMLNAVTRDFSAIEGVSVSVLRDCRLQSTNQCVREIIVSPDLDYEAAIERCADDVDAVLIIAPETENVLFKLCLKYSRYDFILLNCDPKSIALAADKFQTYLFLEQHAVNQVPTFLLNDIEKIKTEKLIAKPRDGVGCENILLADNHGNIQELNIPNDYILQPYIQGQHLSLSLLCWNKECLLLSVNQQHLVEVNDTLVLERCIVNDLPPEPFIEFTQKLISVFIGLKGYVGVDLIVSNDDFYLVEVNPRLTTSYVGIRSAIDINPAKLMLQTFIDRKLPTFKQNKSRSIIVDTGDTCAA